MHDYLIKHRNSLEVILTQTRNSSLVNNAFYLMLNTAITSILGFVFWNIMARIFTNADVGIGSALISASGLIASLSVLGFGVGLIRYLPELGKKAVTLSNTAFTVSGLTAGFISIVYLIGIRFWAPPLSFIANNYLFSMIFIIFTSLTVVYVLIDSSLIAGHNARYVFLKNTFASLIKIPLPICAFYFLKGFGIFVATGLSMSIMLIISFMYFVPRVFNGYVPRLTVDISVMKQVFPYSISNYLANLFNLAPNYLFPLMVLNILGAEQSAYFYIVWMISVVLTLIPTSLSQSLLAEGSSNNSRLAKDGRRSLAVGLILSIPAVIIMMIAAHWILHFFGASYAEHGTVVLRCLSLSIIPLCVNSLFITVNQIKKQTGLIIAQTGFLALVALALGYILLIKIGLVGLAVAYTAAQLILSLVVIWPLMRAFGRRPVNIN